MNRFASALSLLLTSTLSMGVLAQSAPAPRPATPRPAPAAQPAAAPTAAAVNIPVDNTHIDLLVKEQAAQGQADSPQLRDAIRSELQTREVLSRAAKQKGLDRQNEIKAQMDLSAQSALIRAYLADYSKANGPTDASLKSEYDRIRGQLGDKEYRARHVLVEKKTEAEDIIKALQAGQPFEKLAERSKDEGSKANGGDLDWAAPGNYVKPFAEAMIALQKGKFTAQPVETQFGWHVIRLEDVRDAKIPPFEEVKPQLQQRLQNEMVQKHVQELRNRAGLQ